MCCFVGVLDLFRVIIKNIPKMLILLPVLDFLVHIQMLLQA